MHADPPYYGIFIRLPCPDFQSCDILPGAKWHLNRSRFDIRTEYDLAAFFKVVAAFCNKITLCSLFFWIQVDF